MSPGLLIGLVGPCGAGKSTMSAELKKLGYQTRHIAQEHSYVADMWKRLTHPDVLVYLAVSYPKTIQRRQLDWTLQEYEEQLHRLRHARQFADLTIDTSDLTVEQVLGQIVSFLESLPG